VTTKRCHKRNKFNHVGLAKAFNSRSKKMLNLFDSNSWIGTMVTLNYRSFWIALSQISELHNTKPIHCHWPIIFCLYYNIYRRVMLHSFSSTCIIRFILVSLFNLKYFWTPYFQLRHAVLCFIFLTVTVLTNFFLLNIFLQYTILTNRR